MVMVIKSRRSGWARNIDRMKKVGMLSKFCKPRAERPLEWPRSKCEDNIRMYTNPSSGYFPYHLTLPQ